MFVGQMYLVLHTAEAVRMMQVHFEGMVRSTRIHPHEVSNYIRGLSAA